MLPGKQSLVVRTEYDEKLDVITGYLELYASLDGRVLTPQMYTIYVKALEDMELRKIKQGLEEYLRCGKKWPWPGELREWIEEEV